MRIVSINIGKRRRLEARSFRGDTGIFKEPVSGRVVVGALGLQDDAVVNGKHHGGPDQAVYLYRQEDYDWWSEELGKPVAPGTFGDNLTLAGLPAPALVIGCRLEFAELELEVTAPRIPCNTLAARMGDSGFVRRFIEAERPGIYCRVIRPGGVSVGEIFTLEDYPGAPVDTVELFRAAQRRLSPDELRRFLDAPIDERTRAKFESKLAGRRD
ncbi:MAG: MOSC domain-containing protein [Pseudomonadales bacterium]